MSTGTQARPHAHAAVAAEAAAPRNGDPPRGRYLLVLSLTALGVVFGDVGTSPLYALRECFYGAHAVAVSPENILGVLSLIFWALILVISVKYLTLILRADNRGEGGILALMALARPEGPARPAGRSVLVLLGVFGAALLYGDGMITPAISVLSAVEGLEVATPVFRPYVVPITIAILVGLFLVQRRGTASVGAVFGPITLLWFATLAVLGLRQIVREPGVLAAIDPRHAVAFFAHNGMAGFFVLGAVFLVVTGGEAMYADMGHFGRRPIRVAWFGLVLPALLLCYFGQGALLLRSPDAAHNPFYRMAPGWALLPLVALATTATVIASQAIISGAFSLTMQAVQLGYSPRVRIAHTSEDEFGQIYIPLVNRALMLATIGLVLGFRSSSALAAAYGVAVTTDMVFASILFYAVARDRWRWSRWVALPAIGFFLAIDLSFWGSNIVKVPEGGWFPLAVAATVFLLMTTWKRGRTILAARLRAASVPFDAFLVGLNANPPMRVPGTAVFMTGNLEGTPPALLHNLKHNKVLHEQVVLLTVVTEEVPHVPRARRVAIEELGDGFFRLIARFGYMEDPDVPKVLARARELGLRTELMSTTFFLGREHLIASRNPGMALWREKLFALMTRNATSAAAFFRIPPNRVVELGMQIEI
ncbi:MAG TPA: potassium transporter Kup [Longimicrobiales bacterium]